MMQLGASPPRWSARRRGSGRTTRSGGRRSRGTSPAASSTATATSRCAATPGSACTCAARSTPTQAGDRAADLRGRARPGTGFGRDREGAQRRRRARARAGRLGPDAPSARCCTATLYRGRVVWNKTGWVGSGRHEGQARSARVRVAHARRARAADHPRRALDGRARAARRRPARPISGGPAESSGAGPDRARVAVPPDRVLACAASAAGVSVSKPGARDRRPRLPVRRPRDPGPTSARTGYALPVRLADAEIIGRLQRDVLTPARIERAITRRSPAMRRTPRPRRRREAAAARELARLERECTAAGGPARDRGSPPERAGRPPGPGAAAGRARGRVGASAGAPAAARPRSGGAPRGDRGWLRDWHGLLDGEPAQARQLLRKVLVGRLCGRRGRRGGRAHLRLRRGGRLWAAPRRRRRGIMVVPPERSRSVSASAARRSSVGRAGWVRLIPELNGPVFLGQPPPPADSSPEDVPEERPMARPARRRRPTGLPGPARASPRSPPPDAAPARAGRSSAGPSRRALAGALTTEIRLASAPPRRPRRATRGRPGKVSLATFRQHVAAYPDLNVAQRAQRLAIDRHTVRRLRDQLEGRTD